jgi:hypothetical protein
MEQHVVLCLEQVHVTPDNGNFGNEDKKFFLEQELHFSLMKQKFVITHRYRDFTGDRKKNM